MKRCGKMFTENIADFISRITYEQLPPAVIDAAKRAMLDCLAVSLAGSGETASKKIKEYVKEIGGRSESAIIASGFRSHASLAALANGTMAHVLDYDDTEWDWISHPSAVILPAALAIGERVGASGKDVLAGYVVGYEVGARLGLICGRAQYKLGWHTTSTIGSLAACAAASKLLQLEKQKIKWALGITASLASGLQCNFGTATKSFHAGHAAANGVMAVLLAENGFTAAEDALEGERGFCQTFGGGRKFQFSFAPHSLGSSWRIVSSGIALKAYPCCLSAHPSIDAAIHLKKKYGLQSDDIAEVECRTSKAIPHNLPFHEPQTVLQAKFSMEYCVARALAEGKLSVKHFSDEAIRDAQVQELSNKVKYTHQKGLPEEPDLPQEMVVKLRDGNEYSMKVSMQETKGQPHNPLTFEELLFKSRECASVVLPPEQVEHFLKLAWDLDLLKDIRELMGILCFVTNSSLTESGYKWYPKQERLPPKRLSS